jgi:hypothetical protein
MEAVANLTHKLRSAISKNTSGDIFYNDNLLVTPSPPLSCDIGSGVNSYLSGIITVLEFIIKFNLMAKSNEQTINKVRTAEGISERHERTRNFDLVVDGVPYAIRSIPFSFNNELRFRIVLNGATEHIFTWDPQISIMVRPINDDSSVLPVGLEEALSEKLQCLLK